LGLSGAFRCRPAELYGTWWRNTGSCLSPAFAKNGWAEGSRRCRVPPTADGRQTAGQPGCRDLVPRPVARGITMLSGLPRQGVGNVVDGMVLHIVWGRRPGRLWPADNAARVIDSGRLVGYALAAGAISAGGRRFRWGTTTRPQSRGPDPRGGARPPPPPRSPFASDSGATPTFLPAGCGLHRLGRRKEPAGTFPRGGPAHHHPPRPRAGPPTGQGHTTRAAPASTPPHHHRKGKGRLRKTTLGQNRIGFLLCSSCRSSRAGRGGWTSSLHPGVAPALAITERACHRKGTTWLLGRAPDRAGPGIF